MPPSQKKPLVCIVMPKNMAGDALIADMKAVLENAGYFVTAWNDAAQAKEALLNQRYSVVIVIDEILPDEDGDAFLPWISALPSRPYIIAISTGKTYRWATYEMASRGYIFDMLFSSVPSPAELVYFVDRLAVNDDAPDGQEKGAVTDGF